MTDAHRTVVDLLPLVPEASHAVAQTFERVHPVQAAQLIPGLLGEPGAGVGVGVVQAHAPRQEEVPLRFVHLQY